MTRPTAPPPPPRGASLGCWLLACAAALLVLPVAAGYYVLCDWVPASTTARLRGATREEVRELLGDPEPASDPDRWVYRRPMRVGEFRVDFDADGRAEDWSYDR